MPSQSASLTAPPKGEPSSTSNTPAASAMFADSSPKGGAKFHFKYAGSVRNVRCQRLQRRGRSQVPPQIRLQRPQCSLPAPAKEGPEAKACLSLWERCPAGEERALGAQERISHVLVNAEVRDLYREYAGSGKVKCKTGADPPLSFSDWI